MTWQSKALIKYGAAHFVIDGAPACSVMKAKDGLPRFRPVKGGWTERRLRDHICGWCRRLHPDSAPKCVCGRCTVPR